MEKKGMVYLVGAGPGDIELITQKGLRLLKACEVVIYDRLIDGRLLEGVPAECEKIDVGKRTGMHQKSQDEINKLLVKKALEGKRIVRLKGGDPFVFGRGGEEVMALEKAHVAYEVVPGVTSAIAAAAYAGIPITHRGMSQSFHVVTGHTALKEDGMIDNLKALAALEGTLVFLMGMRNLAAITKGLIQNGKDPKTSAAIIASGTTSFQRDVRGTLDTICQIAEKEKIEAPAVIIIGETAGLNYRYTGSDSLIGIRIGIIGTEHLAEKLGSMLQMQGAKVESLGTSSVQVYKESSRLKEALEKIETFRWIVMTSTNAVNVFFEQLKVRNVDYRKLAHVKFAVIGGGTAKALMSQGFTADYMPKQYTAADLAKGLAEVVNKEEKILIPRAEKGSKELITILEAASLMVEEVKTYDVVLNEGLLMSRLEQIGKLDYLIFASSSGVQSFMESGGEKGTSLLHKSRLVCLGEITAESLRERDYTNLVVADTYTAEGVVEKILEDRKNNVFNNG